jgi:three-Cys-motif partner protein
MHIAADGLPARGARSWTEEKLMILETYLAAFAAACKKAGGWYGLDLFAGPGLNWSETRGCERDGSPLIALEAKSPKASKVIAAESSGNSFQALQARTERYGERIHLFRGDANEIIAEMLAAIPPAAPAFAFLDPEGSELEWGTVEAVAAHKRGRSPTKIEQLILFATDTGFMRLAPGHPDLVTRIFGDESWRKTYERRQAGDLSADDARSEYVRLYAGGLKRLGYKVVLDRQIVKSSGQPMYFLIFATDHDAGERIMNHCFDHVRIRVQEELGQGQLFEMKDAPRRRRLRDS